VQSTPFQSFLSLYLSTIAGHCSYWASNRSPTFLDFHYIPRISKMSFSITRAFTNILKVGPRSAWKQLMSLGEVKSGTLVGKDHSGNEYYENLNELWGKHSTV
jgi:hypothetical protein